MRVKNWSSALNWVVRKKKKFVRLYRKFFLVLSFDFKKFSDATLCTANREKFRFRASEKERAETPSSAWTHVARSLASYLSSLRLGFTATETLNPHPNPPVGLVDLLELASLQVQSARISNLWNGDQIRRRMISSTIWRSQVNLQWKLGWIWFNVNVCKLKSYCKQLAKKLSAQNDQELHPRLQVSSFGSDLNCSQSH